MDFLASSHGYLNAIEPLTARDGDYTRTLGLGMGPARHEQVLAIGNPLEPELAVLIGHARSNHVEPT